MRKRLSDRRVRQILETTYDQIYREYDRGRLERVDRKFVGKFVKDLPPKSRVLDVGCGSGRIAGLFEKAGHAVTGIDVSRNMLKLAKKNAPCSSLYQMDMRDLSFPPESFDGMVCLYSIISVPRRFHLVILKKFHKFLRPDGYLLITVGISDTMESVDPFYGAQVYISHFGKEKNFTLLRKADFKIIRSKILGSPTDRHFHRRKENQSAKVKSNLRFFPEKFLEFF